MGLREKEKELVEIFQGWSETTFQKSLQGWSFRWIVMRRRRRRRKRREEFGVGELREDHLLFVLGILNLGNVDVGAEKDWGC